MLKFWLILAEKYLKLIHTESLKHKSIDLYVIYIHVAWFGATPKKKGSLDQTEKFRESGIFLATAPKPKISQSEKCFKNLEC